MVRITWLDACSVDEWTSVVELSGAHLVECTTVGTVVFEDDTRLVVAASHDGNGNYCGVMVIPRHSVTCTEELTCHSISN